MESGKNKEHKHHYNFTTEKLFIGLLALLGIILIVNAALSYSLNSELRKNTEALKEKARPAKIEIALIKNSNCRDCSDSAQLVKYIKSASVNITKETSLEFNSKEAKEIISKYGIQKIPSVVVSGETDKISLEGMQKRDNALVLDLATPPYTNASSGQIVGRVTLYTLTDSGCAKCSNFSLLVSQIKLSGVKIVQEKIVDVNSDEGRSLVSKYKMDFVPALILSKDASAYPIVKQAWPGIGTVEQDGYYIMRTVSPPYINLTTGKLRGLVGVVYLTDKSCAGCYNVETHREILSNPQSFAMKFDSEKTLDVADSEGKSLVDKYNITQVPTVILSSEVGVYPSIAALKQFFSVEKDGSYIFRKLSVVGTYKDLATNQIVEAKKPAQQ